MTRPGCCRLLATLACAAWPHAGAAQPLATLLTGTAKDAIYANTYNNVTSYCLLNASLLPGAAAFSDNGPSVSFYQQDSASSPLTLAFPGMGHGTQNNTQNPTWDFFALGTGALVFSGATAGSITFLPGSIFVPSQTISPSFSQFTSSWDQATNQLTITFTITMGNCSVPFSAVYTD